MARTNTNTQNSTKQAEQLNVADIQNKLFVCFGFFNIFFYFRLLKINSPRNFELPPSYGQRLSFGGFKPVLRYSKSHTFSTFIGVEKEKNAFTFSTQAT